MDFRAMIPNVAILISSIALIVSIITTISQIKYNNQYLKSQQYHNIISLRPFCFIELNDYENYISVILVNNGLGSAVIDDLIIKNKKYPNKIYNVLIDCVVAFGMYNVNWTDFTEEIANSDNSSDRVISANGRIVLLTLAYNKRLAALKNSKKKIFKKFKQDKTLLRNILKDVTIEVRYRDFYGNHYSDCKRDCSFFGRNLLKSPCLTRPASPPQTS